MARRRPLHHTQRSTSSVPQQTSLALSEINARQANELLLLLLEWMLRGDCAIDGGNPCLLARVL